MTETVLLAVSPMTPDSAGMKTEPDRHREDREKVANDP